MNERSRSAWLGIILLFLIFVGDLLVGIAASGVPSVCPSSPSSPCWTRVQHSPAGSCTIAVGNTACIQTITFSPAYTITPQVSAQYTGTIITAQQTNMLYVFGQEPLLGSSESFDTSYVNADIVKTASPMTLTVKGVAPNTANEFGVLIVYMIDTSGNAVCFPTFTVSSVTDTQTNGWSEQLDPALVAADCVSGITSGFVTWIMQDSVWTTTLASTSTDTITITITDNAPSLSANIGATLELFKNVAGVSTVQVANNPGALSDSVSVTPLAPNDFIVGAATLAVATSGVCDSITLSAPTTTRQTDAGCATNLVINFAGGDQHPTSTSPQTFAATYGAADGDIILAMDLFPTLSQGVSSTITSSLGELFGGRHEIQYVTAQGAGLTITGLYSCLYTSNPTSTVTIKLFAEATGSTGAVLTCDGRQRSMGAVSGLTVNTQYLVTVKAQCTSYCPVTVVFTSLYARVAYSINQLPSLLPFSLSKTSVQWDCAVVVPVTVAKLCTYDWWAGIPA